MSRRKIKPQRIAVEDRSADLPNMRLGRAMRVLRVHDPARFMKFTEIIEGIAQIYAPPSERETEAEWQARLARINGHAREGN